MKNKQYVFELILHTLLKFEVISKKCSN